MKYYIVIGSAGAYSDHEEWPIAVYTDKESADEHCKLSAQVAETLEFLGWNYRSVYDASKGDYNKGEDLKKRLNPFDVNWRHQTSYGIREVESGQLPALPSPASRAPKTGQCQDCCYTSDYLDDNGNMPTHLAFTKETQAKGYRHKRADGNEYCLGGGKPPRSVDKEDYEGWTVARKAMRW